MEKNRLKSPMKSPPHPGEILKELYLEPLELSITNAAIGLNVTRKVLSQLVNGHSKITPDMALRLSEAFNTTPQLWMNLQQNFGLYQAGNNVKNYEIQHFWSGKDHELQSA